MKTAGDWKPGTPGLTIGELYGPAMAITDQAEADEYFERLVQHARVIDPATPLDMTIPNMRANLGYWAGYYDHETRERVERLFQCAHPIFGAIAEKGPPTAEHALAAGRLEGTRSAMRAALGALAAGHSDEATRLLRVSLGDP